jgi:hypothetical protein
MPKPKTPRPTNAQVEAIIEPFLAAALRKTQDAVESLDALVEAINRLPRPTREEVDRDVFGDFRCLVTYDRIREDLTHGC